MSQWGTRYNLVKDIATGLQYVHHEYEPMVLHRDIKASNIMIDFNFQGRLGDFGLACVLANGKDSYTDYGAPGTLGFRAPEYVYNGKATRKTDIFAFGVLVLEIVTGKRAVGKDVQFGHVTDWVWKLHAEGNLLAAVDVVLTTTSEFDADEAIQLLQLGMACSSPNPSDRPSMTDAVQIISKSVPPPDIPLSKPPLVWPPEGWGNPSSTSDYSTLSTSNFNTTSTFMVEMTAGTEHTS
jgi:interleukin-1 receptor-associated kinase 1